MPPEQHLNPADLDLNRVIADQEAIRTVNPQRFAMEQLSAVVLLDRERQLIAGYRDVRPEEFWVAGHMPGYPLLPGVLICEAAAQLCSYYLGSAGLPADGFIGLGGMENVRFRSPVRPGDRLVLIAKVVKLHRRQMTFNIQGFVGPGMVFHGDLLCVPLTRKGES